MIKKSLTIIILFWISCLLMSCAGSEFIPEGSQSLGVYEGSFDGDVYGGTIRTHLFQTSEGDKLFTASVAVVDAEPSDQQTLFVRGKMTMNSLKGEFQGYASGTLSGQLSSDGNQLTGSFNLTAPGINDGTWQARKK
jgi:hypothetical protein